MEVLKSTFIIKQYSYYGQLLSVWQVQGVDLKLWQTKLLHFSNHAAERQFACWHDY